MTDFAELVRSRRPILTDGGIETHVMFDTDYELDPDVQVGAMVDDDRGRGILEDLYPRYVAAGAEAGLPVVIGTPTFRASENFTRRAGLDEGSVERLNRNAAELHWAIRAASGAGDVFIAGVLGPSGDAYTPAENDDAEAAEAYHRRQAEALAAGGVDFLFAATFPAVPEGLGASRAMGATGLPYVISWVLDGEGNVLDGTPLAEAIGRVDESADPPPLTHSISCVHPTVAAKAVEHLRADAPDLVERLGELKANGSPLPTEELVKLDHPEGDPPERFADEMAALLDPDGLHVLGGCCGTTDAHMRALAARLAGA
jgi:homocysteine S-methyltransferase